jgi:uncharacterized protein (TIGR02145 family)
MKARSLLLVMASGIISGTMGQNTIDLTFTSVDSATYVQLDSIKVMNRTQGGDTTLYYPDTVLSIYYVGVPKLSPWNNAFQVFHNYPNPVADQTIVSLYIPEKDKVGIIVTDILGRVVVHSERVLDKGKHSFRFTPGNGNLCFFTATWQRQRSSIKILQTNPISNNTGALEYIGYESSSPKLKATKDIQSFFVNLGDELLYIGYFDTQQSGMLDSPQESQNYTFQFATNIPCPGTPTVEYEGQVYNTIQIFSQCWLKENLNAGTMIPGTQNMSNNSNIEKYCYNNKEDSCTKYGGLYQWDEIMQYIIQQGVQGICPAGWHLPTDEEWKVMEGAVDSQYGIGDPEWDFDNDFRGFDAGTNLKSTSGWKSGGNGNNLFSFSGLPGGGLVNDHLFLFNSINGLWWTSTGGNSSFARGRQIHYLHPEVYRSSYHLKVDGFSVRCLRD